MCGIVGVHAGTKSGFYSTDKDQLKQMLVVNSLRGAHSTGLFGVEKSDFFAKEVAIIKSIGSPYMLFDWDRTDTFFNKMLSTFGTVVGHGRYATRGEVNAINAHPFKEGNITLVHNGVIGNFHQLHDTDNHSEIAVDSHLIARLFADEGALNVLPRIRGSYTFVWWDSNEKTLNMARNKERPLFLAQAKNKDGLTFSSEAETLLWNAHRSKTPIHGVQELPEFTIYKYKQGSSEVVDIVPYKEKFTSYPIVTHTTSSNEQEAPKSSVVTLTPRLRKKDRTGGFSKAEEHVYDHTTTAHTIERGVHVSFGIDDYKETVSNHNTVMVYGSSEAYPNVEFCVVASLNANDHNLTSADSIVGEVATMYPMDEDASFLGQPWRVYITGASLKMVGNTGSPVYVPLQVDATPFQEDDEKDSGIEYDTFVTMSTITSGDVKIPVYRLKEMTKNGCGWCTADIPEIKDIRNYDYMLLWEDHTNEFNLVCPVCTHSYLTSGKE